MKKEWHYVERTDARGLVKNGCLVFFGGKKVCSSAFFFRIVLVVGAKRGGLEVDVCRM